jgi:putative peptide modification system cyclase
MTAFANAASTTPAPLLRTLVLCDLADSTALTERLGDRDAADLFRRHDRLVRDLLPHHAGREIDKTDGFLLVFERPVQAVAFALAYQRQLAELAAERKLPLTARVGIHFGDVVVWENERGDVERGAKPTELEGLVKPVTARLAQLALPGQILLSGTAYDIAHRAQGELGAQLGSVRWLAHGRYRFKGVPDPVPVFEVGEEGIAPLKPPPWSSKAHREVPFWRRPAMLAAELGLLAVAIAVPAIYLLKPAPALAFANRDWVVVGDLKNLTGESKFDESLQTAFRIGLEQSRYVNVMSDLKARETLKLMQRDPDKTPIDRGVGAEIALRDSARALILPTVAEIGGRVRVTAEVIDPKSQATVYSESADGVGEDSVLPSLDKVNQQLRVRLGEALASVSSESKPLDKATTKNLDALRAFSLGRRAYNAGNLKEALALEQQAVALDPDFALAHTTIAAVYYSVGDYTAAQREIDLAGKNRDRLSARDALYVDAWKSQFGPPLIAMGKWKALARLYPDFPLANGSLGFYSWQQNFLKMPCRLSRIP